MIEYLPVIMDKIGFCADAVQYFTDMYKQLGEADRARFRELEEEYFDTSSSDKSAVNESVNRSLEDFAHKNGINFYSVCMLFLLCCSRRLGDNYKKSGIADEIFFNSMCDLTYKLEECKKLYGVYGTFVFKWFRGFFLMERFALGRFQYEKAEFIYDSYEKNGVKLKKGDAVYAFHIPSSGHVTRDKRMDSYRRAYNFFDAKTDGNMIFVCTSWLLYPENENIFPSGSNLLDFMKDFDIIGRFENDALFQDAWRVFNREYTGDISTLPENTSLQKNYKAWLAAGKKVGEGYGVIAFDGEKIVNL